MRRSVCIVAALCVAWQASPAASAKSSDPECMMKRATAYFNKGAYPQAAKLYRKLLDVEPNNAVACNNLGVITSRADKHLKESVMYFLKAAQLDPSYPEPLANLGVITFKVGRFDMSELYLKKAVYLDPRNPVYYFTLGWVYATGLKNQELAMQCLKKAISLNPDYAEAHYMLGLVYVDLDRVVDVFDEITALRRLHQEDYAGYLESLIRPPYVESEAPPPPKKVEMGYEITPGTAMVSGTGAGTVKTSAALGVAPRTLAGSGTVQMKFKIRGKPQIRTTIKPKK